MTDRSSIEWAWDEAIGSNRYPCVLQDVWHALQHIITCMSKYHPDFSSSKKELQSIFAKLQTSSAYDAPTVFADALKQWEHKWKTCSLAGKLDYQQQIMYLGIFNV